MDARPLLGCVNDARLMHRVLVDSYAFEPSRICLLLDRDATREAILEALDDLLRETERDDLVFVHFSGHGSQVEWQDGLAESIVPHDSGRKPHPNRDIVDVEIAAWISRLSRRTPYLTLVVDACHAGSIARLAVGVRQVPADRRRPDEQGRPELAPWVDARARRSIDAGSRGPSGWLPLSERYTLIAGCKSDERSCELEDPETGVVHGALSACLADEMRRAPPRSTWREVVERAAIRVTGQFPHQHPQLEGARDREVLGRRELVPMRFVPVTRRRALSEESDAVVLDAGAVHGVVPRSCWDVFPQASREPRPEDRLGHLRVGSVGAVESQAEIVGERAPGAIAVGARAVERERPVEAPRLRVGVEGGDDRAAAVAQHLGASPLLRLCLATEHRDVVLRRLEPGSASTIPVLCDLGRRAWIVTDPLDRLLMSPRLDHSAVEKSLRDDLERWARYRALIALQQTDLDDPLRSTIELRLRRRSSAGAWVDADAASGAQPSFEEGEELSLSVRHRHDRPLYVAVYDLGLSGAVQLLYPVPGARDPLQPHQLLELGGGEDDALVVGVPETLPFDGGAFTEGQEVIKLIAAEQETDFALLTQKGVRRQDRADPAAASQLDLLLGMALTGEPVRTVITPAPESGERWTTLSRSFKVTRTAVEG